MLTAEYQYGDVVISCTNVDRVVFPDCGLTKGDVIAHYDRVAPHMIPDVAARPLTMERFTKGLAGGGFFQKHWQKHYPSWLSSVALPSAGKRKKKKKKKGESEEEESNEIKYPTADQAAVLVYLANQGAIAFHVGLCKRGAIQKTDTFVVDLDPPEGDVDIARRSARAVRELMDELGLPVFLKTTGSKGLHLFVPVDAASYRDIALFGNAASQALCAEHPDLVTTEFYKKDRKRRLYLDMMRNTPGATVVAAWSVRGKKGAPVSVPITWDELDKVTPDGFHIPDIERRLETVGNPWRDLRAKPGSLADAMARLTARTVKRM